MRMYVSPLRSFSCAVAALLISALRIHAATIIFQEGVSPSGYTQGGANIRSDATTTNDSTSPTFIPGQLVTGSDLRTVFSYDLSAIPSGSTITSVTLDLKRGTDATSDNSAFTLELRPLTASFVEGEVTWARRSTAAAWTTAGGDFSATTLLSSTSANPTTATALTFASSPEFVAATQSAVSSATPLQFILKLDAAGETGTTRHVFQISSDDSPTAANRPALTVTYVPEPGSIFLTLCGGLGLLITLRRRF